MRKGCLALLLASTGCAATTTVETVGEAGLLVYRTTVMHTGRAPSSWSEARFALGESYAVSVELTELGTASLSEPAAVEHRLQAAGEYAATPDDEELAGEVVHHSPVDDRDVPDLELHLEMAGTLWLEARVGEESVDVVELQVVAGHLEVPDGVVYGREDGRW